MAQGRGVHDSGSFPHGGPRDAGDPSMLIQEAGSCRDLILPHDKYSNMVSDNSPMSLAVPHC